MGVSWLTAGTANNSQGKMNQIWSNPRLKPANTSLTVLWLWPRRCSHAIMRLCWVSLGNLCSFCTCWAAVANSSASDKPLRPVYEWLLADIQCSQQWLTRNRYQWPWYCKVVQQAVATCTLMSSQHWEVTNNLSGPKGQVNDACKY